MTNHHRTQREKGHKVRDLPEHRKGRRSNDHQSRAQRTEHKSPAEPLDQFGHLLEEVRLLDLFRGGAPRHVDFEEVAEERLRDVQGDAAEEEGEEEEPLEVLPHYVHISIKSSDGLVSIDLHAPRMDFSFNLYRRIARARLPMQLNTMIKEKYTLNESR